MKLKAGSNASEILRVTGFAAEVGVSLDRTIQQSNLAHSERTLCSDQAHVRLSPSVAEASEEFLGSGCLGFALSRWRWPNLEDLHLDKALCKLGGCPTEMLRLDRPDRPGMGGASSSLGSNADRPPECIGRLPCRHDEDASAQRVRTPSTATCTLNCSQLQPFSASAEILA